MIPGCPNCGCIRFSCDAVPANEAAIDNSARHGNWFNKCMDCGEWSQFDEATGSQIVVDNPKRKPAGFKKAKPTKKTARKKK